GPCVALHTAQGLFQKTLRRQISLGQVRDWFFVRNGSGFSFSLWMFIFFALAAKKTNQKKRPSQSDASARPAGS
ncbi:hypothetical protein QN344_08445, partial [Mucilaginibacter sp. 5B2]|nr:hypothetical protein [Mucilaginibacter sp. 5B2]